MRSNLLGLAACRQKFSPHMRAPRRSRLVVLMWRMHRWLYLLTGGKVGGRILGMPVLLLIAVGRRSGKSHTTALTYVSDTRGFVVVASNGGAPHHPDWYLNLQARPEARVQIGARTTPVHARVAAEAERERLWARAVAAYRGYAGYQRRATRRIPVVVLEPVEEGVR